jgi:hypothetical protein
VGTGGGRHGSGEGEGEPQSCSVTDLNAMYEEGIMYWSRRIIVCFTSTIIDEVPLL